MPRRSRWKERLLALLVGSVLALGCCEGGMRWLVLSDSALALRFGGKLRHAEWFADGDDDDFWKLVRRFDSSVARCAARPDRLTGWLTDRIAPGTHEHADASAIGTRTPVLLYGDSFAEGFGPGALCFEGLLEASPLRATHALLNYGVGGYGADQVLLLARDTLPRFEARAPVAVAALLVDDDLDRCVLEFRSGPKPRFRVRDGVLLEPAPVETDAERFLEQHPLGIPSYALRLLGRAPGLLPDTLQFALRGEDEHMGEKQALSEALVRALCRALRAHSPRPALMLMRALESARSPRSAWWQEELVRRVAAEEEVPVIDTREALLAAAGGRVERLANLYTHEGARRGHWNGLGYLAAFEALRAFLEGGGPEEAQAHVEELLGDGRLFPADAPVEQGEWLGGEWLAQGHDRDGALCFTHSREATEDGSGWFFGVRAGNAGPTFLRWALPNGKQRLALRLRTAPAGPGPEQLVLHAGTQVLHLRNGDPPLEWSPELPDGVLRVRVDPPAEGGRTAWVLLEGLRLE